MDAARGGLCIHGSTQHSFFALISQVIYLYGMEINKLRPLETGWSVGQMGQHSPKGISGLGHSLSSSQSMSSQRIVPVSQTQIWQGSGFHTSLSLYLCPSCTQLPASSVPEGEGKSRWGQVGGIRKAKNQKKGEEKKKQGRNISTGYRNPPQCLQK